MRGIAWTTFHPDWYLDFRRPEWAQEERAGHVQFDGATRLVRIHFYYGGHIVDVLALRGTASPTGR